MAIGIYESALIGVGGVISGALIGAWISYRLSIHLNDYQTKKEAGRRLISTFHTELSEVYPYPIKWPKDIAQYLESKFVVLNAAVGEYRHYLPEKERSKFDESWFKYYNATGREIDNKNCQCYHHYMPFVGTSSDNGKTTEYDNRETCKQTMKDNVDRILSFVNL